MLNRLPVVICLLISLVALPQSEARAQFWKKKNKKEQKRPAQQKSDSDPAHHGPVKKQALEYPASKIKTRYRIDVLIPLYLESIVRGDTPVSKDQIPEKALAGLNFYEGVKLATDTLSSLGYNIDVYVHDVTQNNLSPDNLVKLKTLKGTDLIIGALPSNQLAPIADFAKKNSVNFVSAMSPSDAGITDNLFFTMIQPQLSTHCNTLNAAIAKKQPAKAALLFYRTNNQVDSVAAGYFRREQSYTTILWNSFPARSFVATYLDSSAVNLIAMPILDVEYADSILRYLNREFPNHRFEVYGMPTWKFITSIKKADALPNIGIHFTTPFYFEPSSSAVQSLVARYKKMTGNRPPEPVFIGYETFYWHAYLLNKYGTVFNNRFSDLGGTAFTRMDVKPQWATDGRLLYNENEHVYMYRYQAGSYMVE